MIKIGIIGHGFVGKALDNGINESVSKKIIDPKYGNSILEFQQYKPEFIFVCVPTPMGKDEQDFKILDDVFDELASLALEDTTIVLKSTILPDKILDLNSKFPNLIYNPEFLREKHADEDFKNSEFIIIGGDKKNSLKLKDFYQNFSLCLTPDENYIFTSIFNASISKYSINTFLASKVLFFNQIYSIFKANNLEKDYEEFTNIIAKDSRIGSSHMKVPGNDGRYGFGGACFPKDTYALIKYFKKMGISFSLLEHAYEENKKIRSKYRKRTDREVEQKITFEE